jgi:exopolyphosphatase/guanosine-5'-triphosphate,3'-diphosphate pyrophosphatase
VLRLAESLDRSHGQHVRSFECQLKNGEVTLRVTSAENIDLELWAARQAAEVFQQVYERPLTIQRDSGRP